jgi:putative glycosyltransferase (TIGR04348 family)
VTALRWARILRNLGHRVTVLQEYERQPVDLLIALHARRSAKSVARFHRRFPARPVVVALTGTDLYRDIRTSKTAQRSLDLARRLILLQSLGLQELPRKVRHKARVIYQSVARPQKNASPLKRVFEVCVLGHLRPVKDPLRTAMASRRLPPHSRIGVTHLGAALSDEMADRARAEMSRNPRYRWRGELPRRAALRILARSRLLVLTSRLEGGANVVSEALAAGVPIVSSRIAGSMGILGEDYPGYFPVGDTQTLSELLASAESDAAFYRTLKQRCRQLARFVEPSRERQAWAKLLRELDNTKAGGR